nr:uncharacterized protein LOC111505834 isoform X2 [Leptinotarsa decemlineata]
MKVLIVFALAILAYVEADCGCLKCSKHLTIAGEINGAPGHKPIKVIYRCQNGIGSCPHYPNALPIEVQKPLAIPEETPPLSCGKGQYSYGMQAFYNNPSFISSYQGIYDNSHHGFSHGITHGTSHDSTNGGTDDSYAQGLGIHPITVQKPIPVSGGDITNCVPMSGLKASIDRVVLPSNPFPAFRKLIDSTDRYNPVYKDCPQLLCQRERHSCKKCCGCAPPPTIQLLHENRYY